MAGKLRSSATTVSPAEAIGLAKAAKAARAPAFTEGELAELQAFRKWQAAKAAQQERATIGVSKMTLHDVEGEGRIGFRLEGVMPDAPNEKAAFLNDNKKVVVDGIVYTLQTGLYPYKGAQTLEQLRALGVIVGEF